jgi:predicted protein tyrosine phosphatase
VKPEFDIVVLGRREAKEFISDVPWAAISISTYPDEFPKLNKCQRVGLLQLAFADLDELDRWAEEGWDRLQDTDPEYKVFQYSQAQEIWNFVASVKDKIKTLLVHCEAGVSRSPAIAAAISEVILGRPCKVPGSSPNLRVYAKLMIAHENNLAAAQADGYRMDCKEVDLIEVSNPGIGVAYKGLMNKAEWDAEYDEQNTGLASLCKDDANNGPVSPKLILRETEYFYNAAMERSAEIKAGKK